VIKEYHDLNSNLGDLYIGQMRNHAELIKTYYALAKKDTQNAAFYAQKAKKAMELFESSEEENKKLNDEQGKLISNLESIIKFAK
jgi:antirestriction protein ArdC